MVKLEVKKIVGKNKNCKILTKKMVKNLEFFIRWENCLETIGEIVKKLNEIEIFKSQENKGFKFLKNSFEN